MKMIFKLFTLLLALAFVFGLAACGGAETEKDGSSTNTVSNTSSETASVDLNSTITMPDFEVGGLTEKNAIFVYSAGGEDNEVKVYYKDNVIQSITLTAVAPYEDRTDDEMKQLKEQMDSYYAEANAKDFISYSCVLSDKKISIVIAAYDLEIKENMDYYVTLEFFEGLTAQTTYTEFVEILNNEGFTEKE